jgi:hypothetical protein
MENSRLAAVIRFKPGVSKERAAKVLASIADFVEYPATTIVPTSFTKDGQKRVRYDNRPFKHEDAVHEYDESYGHPVFYVP